MVDVEICGCGNAGDPLQRRGGSWGRKLAAARALLDLAETALDRAEATDDPIEKHRLLALFELHMSSADPQATTTTTDDST